LTDVLAVSVLALACGLGTYLWRGLGVALSGRINPAGGFFVWVGCVAYSMVAGLVVRIILMPAGSLGHTLLEHRLAACAAALAAYFLARRNLLFGILVGLVLFVGLSHVPAA
jgi:branched-subunit amino acid transport protein